ncbi:hypothetical protein [Streptomyces sp. NPDC046197]|uniref:hypothetical protein n=1 Tax=Streptomyces sp. NPDC046197 TaxID=3154337 RepID=UPI0033F23263
MSRAHIGSAVATLVLISGSAGCGGSEGSGSAAGDAAAGQGATSQAQAVQDAYRRTVAAGTAKLTVVGTAVTEGQQVAAHGSGVVALKDGASRMTLTSRGARIEQRVVDGVAYQKPSGPQRADLPGGKTWMKIDLARLTRSGSAGQSQVSDSIGPLRCLKGVRARDVTRVGTGTVDGTSTTHYRVAVPVSALAGGNSAQSEELRHELGTSSPPVDLWLDGRGRLRQERVRLTLHPLGQRTPGKQNAQVTSTTVLKFKDFGTRVDVTPPPAADTADITGQLVGAGRSAQPG